MRYLLILVILLSGCRFNCFDNPLEEDFSIPAVNSSIGELRYLAGTGEIRGDMVIGGVVTSSDSAGNIYRQLYVEDCTGAVALQVGLFDMYVRYPVGSRVNIRLQGLACGYNEGMMVVGAIGNEQEYPVTVETINSPALVGRYLFSRGSRVAVAPREVRLGDIGEDMIGRLVLVEGFFVEGGVGVYGGERRFEDYWGGGIDVYTSAYASFSGDLLPWGGVKMMAIVGSFGGKLQLIISSTDDVISVE